MGGGFTSVDQFESDFYLGRAYISDQWPNDTDTLHKRFISGVVSAQRAYQCAGRQQQVF